MGKKFTDSFCFLLCTVLIFQLIGCGTILYPERKGQLSGKIDGGVAVLDGIGLLFFLVPGIIAFAIDFNNGTIYLPGTLSQGDINMDDIKQVKFDSKDVSQRSIERIIKEETGLTVKLDQPNMKSSRLKSSQDILKKFTDILPSMRDNRIAHKD